MAVGRNVLAGLGGIIAAGVTVALVEAIGHAAVAGEGVFGVAVGGYALGALVGTAIAQMIADRRTAVAAPVVLAMLATVNLLSFPHPSWFAPAAVAALTLGWWIGSSVLAPNLCRKKGPGQ